jgi:hypothetical protein
MIKLYLVAVNEQTSLKMFNIKNMERYPLGVRVKVFTAYKKI